MQRLCHLIPYHLHHLQLTYALSVSARHIFKYHAFQMHPSWGCIQFSCLPIMYKSL